MKTTPTPHRIHLLDTTLRDGEQAPGCQFLGAEKLRVARQLRRMNVDVIEAGFPVSSPGEFEAVKRIADEIGAGDGAPVIAAFGRSVDGDIDACWNAIRNASHPRIHTFMATSDLHLEHKLRLSRGEAMRRAVAAVKRAKGYADDVQFSAEDSFRSDRAFLIEIFEAAIDAGATTINVCDTVGYAMPEEFGALVALVKARVRGVERARISVHCHDDLGHAVANALAGVRNGATQVEGTVNGIGERAGNAAVEEVAMALRTRADYFGADIGLRTSEISRTSRLVARITGARVAANKAVVGANAFAHGSGVHQDGMIKHRSTYEIMRPEDVGATSTLVLTARSGRRAIAHRLAQLGRPATDLDAVYRRFKEIADGKDRVTDADLMSIAV
jgi:2-isopropylmalate synthase